MDTITKAIIFSDTKQSLYIRFLYWWVYTWIYRKCYQYTWLYDLRWYITSWWRQDNVLKTNLPIGYCDYVGLIEDALFAAVEGYISRDGEDAPSNVVIEDEVMIKIIEILHFYRIRKPEMEAEENRLLHEMYKDRHMKFIPATNGNKNMKQIEWEYTGSYTPEQLEKMEDDMRFLEKKVFDKTQEMLKKVIDIRPYMWT